MVITTVTTIGAYRESPISPKDSPLFLSGRGQTMFFLTFRPIVPIISHNQRNLPTGNHPNSNLDGFLWGIFHNLRPKAAAKDFC